MKELLNRNDIELLITEFYTNLLQIEEMKPVFEGLNLTEHVPKIVNFWAFVLLDEEGYRTNVFDKHIRLPIKPHMFDTWFDTWKKTVRKSFFGEKAELAIQRAEVLSHTFKAKWEKMNPG